MKAYSISEIRNDIAAFLADRYPLTDFKWRKIRNFVIRDRYRHHCTFEEWEKLWAIAVLKLEKPNIRVTEINVKIAVNKLRKSDYNIIQKTAVKSFTVTDPATGLELISILQHCLGLQKPLQDTQISRVTIALGYGRFSRKRVYSEAEINSIVNTFLSKMEIAS